jgi:hypothetical protein
MKGTDGAKRPPTSPRKGASDRRALGWRDRPACLVCTGDGADGKAFLGLQHRTIQVRKKRYASIQ